MKKKKLTSKNKGKLALLCLCFYVKFFTYLLFFSVLSPLSRVVLKTFKIEGKLALLCLCFYVKFFPFFPDVGANVKSV